MPNNIKLRLKVSHGAVAENRGAALTSDDLVNRDARGNRNKIYKKKNERLRTTTRVPCANSFSVLS